MDLDMCFHYMVNKIPLPPGLEQAIQDVQSLAMSAFSRRDEALNIRYLEANSFKEKYERYVRRVTATTGTQNRIGNRRIERFIVTPK